MKKLNLIIGLTILSLMLVSRFDRSAYAEDPNAGIAKTGLMYGKVSLDGLNQMIYYLEKIVSDGTGDKKNAEESLKNARKAHEFFKKAIDHAEILAGMKKKSPGKKE